MKNNFKTRCSTSLSFLLAISLLAGCSNSENQNVATSTESGTTATAEATTEPTESADELSIDDLQFTEYSLENDFATEYLVAVKNNSNITVGLSANATAYDASNGLLGADTAEIDVLGPNEESVFLFYFDGVSGVDHIDYKDNIQYSVGSNLYYEPVISNLSVQDAVNGDVLTLAVTNNGEYDAEFVEAYAVFMDANNTPLEIDETYIVDSNSKIAAGATQSEQINYYSSYNKGAFDHVTYYFTGRADKY